MREAEQNAKFTNNDPAVLPMQQGEPSWASWKCGGGTHSSEFGPSPAVDIRYKKCGGTVTGNVVKVVDISDALPPRIFDVVIPKPSRYWEGMIP